MKSEFEKTIPNGTVNADKIFEALRTWVAQSEKELATLRAENARLKLAHENTWQALPEWWQNMRMCILLPF